jgi:hypothetical protein
MNCQKNILSSLAIFPQCRNSKNNNKMDSKNKSGYIFRIQNDEVSSVRGECWVETSKLDYNKISTIKDTVKGYSSKIATSVPSPFARMYLFDTAFKMVADEIEGDSIYHNLVSDCLDVFQLLFSAGNSDNNIKYRIWNRYDRLRVLKEKPDGHAHKILASALDIFFDDQFKDTNNIALIYYKDILIGGTSPLTLLFTSPNWKREMIENNLIIKSPTGDTYFDDKYISLNKRDRVFVEYMWKFYLAYQSLLNEGCEGLSLYIRNAVELYFKEFKKMSEGEWACYRNNPSQLENDYHKINIVPRSTSFLHINDIFAYTIKLEGVSKKIESNSDFKIKSSVNYYKKNLVDESDDSEICAPLVLVKGMTVNGVYTYDNHRWDQNIEIRRSAIIDTHGNMVPLSKRYLPGISHVQYPYVTVEDFLEDNLIKMPFKINSNKFITGYKGDINYLLPIKKEYFNFFTKNDLEEQLIIILEDNKIIVRLEIPILMRDRLSSICMIKEYDLKDAHIAQCNAGFAIYPFYRVISGDDHYRSDDESSYDGLRKINNYTVLFADKNDELKVESIKFWKNEDICKREDIKSKPIARTEKNQKDNFSSTGSYYYDVKSDFDIIEVKLSDKNCDYSGIIIPKFREVTKYGKNKEFTVAIDFGTTNTHVAFVESNDDKKPKAFEIKESDMQMVLLNKPGESENIAKKYRLGYGGFPEIDILVNSEFIPSIIGKEYGSYASFPIRSATAEKVSFDKPDLFSQINVGFYIDSDEGTKNNSIYQTNLKWILEKRDKPYDAERIYAFIKEILMLIKNKVFMCYGDIDKTKVIWMRPLSMKYGTEGIFIKKWQEAFEDVFAGTNAELQGPHEESVAPYYYLKTYPDDKIKDFADAINIDIGGGTTDAMLFMRKTNTYLSTSFKFAGGDIWGDGYNGNEKDNGFIQNLEKYRDGIKNKDAIKESIYKNFINNNAFTSEDVVGLLFRYDEYFKFTESIIRFNPELKIVLVLHYGAIIYHLIQIIEGEKLKIPRYFTFTGKGSQYINVMCDNKYLTKFTVLLIKVYTKLEIPEDFKVVITKNSKEATASGAVLLVNSGESDEIKIDKDNIKNNWGCETDCAVSYERNITKIHEVVADTKFHDSVLNNVQKFIDITLSNNDVIRFLNEYEIGNIEKHKKYLLSGNPAKSGELYDSYYTVLRDISKKEDEKISETFFFHALKDSLYSLSKEIAANKITQQ